MASRHYNRLKQFPTDLTIKCHNRSFEAHRTILVCVSDYFNRLLFGEFPSDSVVNLPDIDGDVFQMILDIIYEDSYPEIETVEDYVALKEYIGYFGMACEGLFALTKCPDELFFELGDHLSKKEYMAVYMRDLPTKRHLRADFTIYLYEKHIIDDDFIKTQHFLLENKYETVTKLYKLRLEKLIT